ncbi:MAG: hypothetical protein AABX16_00675 [Nanoarchaeota archaeon]
MPSEICNIKISDVPLVRGEKKFHNFALHTNVNGNDAKQYV